MKNEKKTEFYWEPFGKNSNKKILTHVLPLHYGYMLYLFDLELTNLEFMRNIDYIENNLINYLKNSRTGLKHKNLMYLFGDNFKYIFLNMDFLIEILKNDTINLDYQNKLEINEKINIFYSTP